MKLIATVTVVMLTVVPASLSQSDPRSVCNKVPGAACLEVTLAGDGHGKVSSQPWGISCPADCVAVFQPYRQKITLTATAVSGSKFNGWSGGCLPRDSRTCIVSLTAATFVTARFEK